MLTGSKTADSIAISVVASVISLSAPPMTPAMPIGPARVGDDQRVRRQVALDVVEGFQPLARRSPGER